MKQARGSLVWVKSGAGGTVTDLGLVLQDVHAGAEGKEGSIYMPTEAGAHRLETGFVEYSPETQFLLKLAFCYEEYGTKEDETISGLRLLPVLARDYMSQPAERPIPGDVVFVQRYYYPQATMVFGVLGICKGYDTQIDRWRIDLGAAGVLLTQRSDFLRVRTGTTKLKEKGPIMPTVERGVFVQVKHKGKNEGTELALVAGGLQMRGKAVEGETLPTEETIRVLTNSRGVCNISPDDIEQVIGVSLYAVDILMNIDEYASRPDLTLWGSTTYPLSRRFFDQLRSEHPDLAEGDYVFVLRDEEPNHGVSYGLFGVLGTYNALSDRWAVTTSAGSVIEVDATAVVGLFDREVGGK